MTTNAVATGDPDDRDREGAGRHTSPDSDQPKVGPLVDTGGRVKPNWLDQVRSIFGKSGPRGG